MGLLMFPVIVNVLGPGYGSEKSVFLSFGFMNRAVRMPDEEYKNIEEDMFVDAENILNEHYEKAFGQTAGSYNYHISSSHLRELRRHGPLTEYTAYPFEGMYAEMRKCYAPGTRKFKKFSLNGNRNCIKI